MNNLNPYDKKLAKFLCDLEKAALTNFVNQQGSVATFTDFAWQFRQKDGKKINYFFVSDENYKNPHFKCDFDKSDLLIEPTRKVLMAYAIHVNSLSLSIQSKRSYHAAARQLLTNLKVNMGELSQSDLTKAEKSVSQKRRLNNFMKWLHDNRLIPPHIKVSDGGYEQRKAGVDIIENKKRKLPNEKALVALGAICYDTIIQPVKKKSITALASQRDAFVCSMGALGMSSPNRANAEQTVLNRQRLKSMTNKNKDGKEETVFYLDWQGSKGFKDNKNHILSNMSECISDCLDYFITVCEPGRVLARFYSNPEKKLSEILGEFVPEKERLQLSKVNLCKSTNLLTLGYLLGFFDLNQTVHVAKSTIDASRKGKRGERYANKLIYNLAENDQIIVSEGKTCKSLLGVTLKKDDILRVFKSTVITTQAFQSYWVKHIKSVIPSFPFGVNSSKYGKVKFENALYCFLGSQIQIKSTSFTGAASHFALVSPETLGTLFLSEINTNSRNNLKHNIFTRHGFSEDFYLTPHQLRHWLDDVAEREGVPHAIINIWSGRKSPEQLLHYVHRSHKDKSTEISDILFDDEVAEEIKPLIVVTMDEYKRLSGIAASETSTGFCTQDLIFSPCEYLNDFETQCPLCSESCHVKGDDKSLSLLKKDLAVQKRRLIEASEHSKFTTSLAVQDWYKLHLINTSMLEELVSLLGDENIENGSVIRVLASRNQIKITNLEKQIVKNHQVKLPDADKALQALLSQKGYSDEGELNDAMSVLGWK